MRYATLLIPLLPGSPSYAGCGNGDDEPTPSAPPSRPLAAATVGGTS